MNKYQARLWRRAMRRQNRQVEKDLAFQALLRNGSYIRDKIVTFEYDPSWKGSYTVYNSVYGSKTPVRGDHFHTTYYNVAKSIYQGCAFLAFVTKRPDGSDFGYCNCSNNSVGSTNFASGWPSKYSKLMSSAQRALNTKVFNAYPAWDIMTDAVELPKTLADCGHLIRAIKEIGTGLLRRDPHQVLSGFGVKPTKKRVKHVSRFLTEYDWHQGPRAIDAASQLWLSYRFGLMPTLKSIDDAMRAGAGLHSVSCEYTSQVTLSDEVNERTVTKILPNPNWVGYTQVSDASYKASVRMKAFITYRYGIKAALLQNPWVAVVRTGWEEVKFSFLVDRFYDVSSYLNSLQLPSIVAQSNVNVSVKQHTYINRSIQDIVGPPPPLSYKLVANGGVLVTTRYESFSRYAGSLSSVPPTLENGLNSFKRQLDALTLGWFQSKAVMSRSMNPSMRWN